MGLGICEGGGAQIGISCLCYLITLTQSTESGANFIAKAALSLRVPPHIVFRNPPISPKIDSRLSFGSALRYNGGRDYLESKQSRLRFRFNAPFTSYFVPSVSNLSWG